VAFYLETLVSLLRADQSGYFLRERLKEEITTTGRSEARLFRRLVPVDSRRLRIFSGILVRSLRLYVRWLNRRNAGPHHVGPFVDEVAHVERDTRIIAFVPPSDTDVVVIVPVYNNWSLTATCLRSLMMTSNETSYRVVVVDDGSTDETPERLADISGITNLCLEENVGFLRAVHAGFASVTEPLVVLLNNDTVVTDGWLDALVEMARFDDTVGVVGAKLLFPDGVLQEAGSLIFKTGSGVNYGKGDRADRSWYEFPREVDYCSGAGILIRHSVWQSTGGFDLDFAPAYYEETDFAFAVRRAGYRVMYQPKSRIYHFEGATYGTDESPKKRSLMDANRQRLMTKWAVELEDHLEPALRHQVGQAWRSARGRILVVDSLVPQTDKDSGSIRMFEIVRILRQMGYAVSFLVMHGELEEPYTSALRDLEVEVLDGRSHYIPEIARLGPVLKLAILSRPEVASKTEKLVRSFAPQAKVIYDTVDLHYVREARRAEIENDSAIATIAEWFRETELGLIDRCDATLVVTDTELGVLAEAAPGADVRIVSNVHSSLPRVHGFQERRDIMFVGNFNHLPNRDAVVWFVEEVFPRVQAALPGIAFNVVGSHLPDQIAALARPGVNIVGWVHDLSPLYDSIRLVVAPLRYGAGIKGKLGESASHGVPFVCTTIAIEGTFMESGRDCLAADEADEFADALISLYGDETTWETMSKNVQRAIGAQCAPEVARAALETLFRDLTL
jgi:O-antigen biosynthesis protein